MTRRDSRVGQDSTAARERVLRTAEDPHRVVLLRGACVLTMSPEIGDFDRADVLIEGNLITQIGEDLSAYAVDGRAEVIELAGAIVLPGFQDTHRHCWQAQLRRMFPDIDIWEYVRLLHESLGPAYRPEDVYVGNYLTSVGALDSGVTTVMDFSHNSRSADHANAAVQAWFDSGMRAVYASSPPLAGTWDGQWPADVSRLISEYFRSDDQLVTMRMGLISKYSPEQEGPVILSEENLRRARELGLAVSVDALFGTYAGGTVTALARDGYLGDDVTFIHCQDIGDDAWRQLADSGSHVSLAPTSDAQYGISSGISPIQKAIDFGIHPALGVDTECSLATDMFTSMRVLLNIQRMFVAKAIHDGETAPPAPMSVREVLEVATVNGARANNVSHKTGSLAPGKEADLIVIGVDDVNNLPLNDPAATVVFGSDSRNIEAVFVAGRVVKWGGEVLGCDLQKLRERVNESRDYLVAHARKHTGVPRSF